MKYLIIFIVFLAACSPKYLPIKETHTRSDTTIIREKTIQVPVPGSSVEANVDSLFKAWQKYYASNPTKQQPRTIYYTDPKLQTRLTIFMDSVGRIVGAKCESLERQVEVLTQEKERIIKETNESLVKEREGFADRLENTILRIFGVLALLIALVVVGGIIYKRITR